jgi:hypothetical protein
MNHFNVKATETGFVMTHALRECRQKLWKKGTTFTNDKLSNEEKDQFINCIGKYIDVAQYSNDAMREGLLQTLQQ